MAHASGTTDSQYLRVSHDQPNWKADFPRSGQGTVVFNLFRQTPFSIVIRPRCGTRSNTEWISLEVGFEKVRITLGDCCSDIDFNKSSNRHTVLSEVTGKACGLEPDRFVCYWFSFDRDGLTVRYGKGYVMMETTHLEHHFLAGCLEQKAMHEKMSYLFGHHVEKEIAFYEVASNEVLETLYASQKGVLYGAKEERQAMCHAKSLLSVGNRVKLYNWPLVANLPPCIIDSSKVTLFDLDGNRQILSASLPAACQELYQNIISKNIDLNWSPVEEERRYSLSDAIRHSIITPGSLLHSKLLDKRVQGGDEKCSKQTYLRVTVGPRFGNSPGVPYVLEIWPKGHGSPVHQHGDAYAVIKVLFGGITIRVFNKHMYENAAPLNQLQVVEGDITWISPNWYQTHQLWNETEDFCATIQCYKYGEEDDIMQPCFNYLSNWSTIEEFLPNSDFEFAEFREAILREYGEYNAKMSYI